MSDDARRPHGFVIAIDGPAAAGKSSTALRVAEHLGFRHIDSGALYRAATAAQARVEADASRWTEASVLAAVESVALIPRDTAFTLCIGQEDAQADIRSANVTRHVSRVAQMPRVRAWVNERVRALAGEYDVVVDGRDMGTAVFPGAAVKIFLVADTWERARRRLVERTSSAPTDAEIAEETARLAQRDARDATQTLQARDAIVIDTTHLTQAEQVHRIVALVDAAMARPRGRFAEPRTGE